MTPLPHGSLPSLPDWIILAVAGFSILATGVTLLLAMSIERARRRAEAEALRRHLAGKEARLST